MAERARAPLSDKARARGIRVAGIAIILLSAGAVFLPAGKRISPDMIGGLLISAGLIEAVAGSLRHEVRTLAMAAGGVTTLAGLLFLVNPETHFFPSVAPVIAWLILRSLILAVSSVESAGSVRMWTAISATVDLLLAILLIAGLSVSTLVISVFGPTPELVASFAWVVAASFVANGLLLLEVSSCAARSAG
ncbi:MAG: hypothetical protein ACM3IG_11815 [Myxococcales bacterium]